MAAGLLSPFPSVSGGAAGGAAAGTVGVGATVSWLAGGGAAGAVSAGFVSVAGAGLGCFFFHRTKQSTVATTLKAQPFWKHL